jgi:hypothetical protein
MSEENFISKIPALLRKNCDAWSIAFPKAPRNPAGRDGALRCPRRVERRDVWRYWHVARDSFRPLMRGWGHRSAMSLPGANRNRPVRPPFVAARSARNPRKEFKRVD